MLRRFSLIALFVSGCLPIAGRAAAQPWPPQPGAVLPRFELGASVGFKERLDAPFGQHDWTGPAAAIDVVGNLSGHLALVGAAESFFDGRTSLLAGARVSTGFFYGNNRDPVPGRFVGKLLVGSVAVDGTTSRLGLQIGGGADVLFRQPRGTGLHWEVGYKIVPGAESRQASGYAQIGLVFGPRVLRPILRRAASPAPHSPAAG